MLTLKKHWLVFVVAGLIILCDQISKYFVIKSGLFYTLNSGIAFSFPIANLVALVLGIIIVIFLFLYGDRLVDTINPWNYLALGFVIGGAMGNLIDRIRLNVVIDFIKIPYWPAFNIADSAIVVGIIFLVFKNLWESRSKH